MNFDNEEWLDNEYRKFTDDYAKLLLKVPSKRAFKGFIRGLWLKHRIVYNEEFRRTWKYAGGDGCSRGKMGFSKNRHYRWWEQLYKNRKFPDFLRRCVCGHPIEENCFITNDLLNPNGRLITIGNCCILKFIPDGCRACPLCETPHRNRTTNRCNKCRYDIFCKSCNQIVHLTKNSKETECAECRPKPFVKACILCKTPITSYLPKCFGCQSKKHCFSCPNIIDVDEPNNRCPDCQPRPVKKPRKKVRTQRP